MTPVPGTVYVLLISHKYGTDAFVHRTMEGAERKLAAYCKEWWYDRGWPDQGECPEDELERRNTYFSNLEDESWGINYQFIEP